MSWTKSNLGTPIPKEIQKALEPISAFITAIQTPLNTLSTALAAAKVFAAAYADPYVALIGATIDTMEQLINDLFASGVYMLTVTPFSFEQSPAQQAQAIASYTADVKAAEVQYNKALAQIAKDIDPTTKGPILSWDQRVNALTLARTSYSAQLKNAYQHKNASLGRQYDEVTGFPLLSASQAIQSAIDSFDDEGDPNRPQFSSSAEVAAFGLMITFPTFQQFLNLLNLIGDLFDFPQLDFVKARAQRFSDVTDFYVYYTVGGKGEDPKIPRRQAVVIALPDGASSSQVAKATADVLGATGVFACKASGFKVLATCNAAGVVVDDPDPGTTGFSTSVVTPGQSGVKQVVEIDVTPNFGSIRPPGGAPVLSPSTLQGTYFLISSHPKTTTSVNPDWQSLRLNSITHLALLQAQLIKLLETLRGYLVVPDSFIPDLIDIIAAKVTALQNLLTAIQTLINSITRVSGVYYLSVPKGVGGNDRIKAALNDSFLQDPCNATTFTLMAVFVGGGPSLVPVETLRGLFK